MNEEVVHKIAKWREEGGRDMTGEEGDVGRLARKRRCEETQEILKAGVGKLPKAPKKERNVVMIGETEQVLGEREEAIRSRDPGKYEKLTKKFRRSRQKIRGRAS